MEPEARISTGNAGLDEMLEGGVIPRRPVLDRRTAGTGKTTLALQFLCEGVRRGERGLLVTIEEPPNEARLNHRGLGPEFDRVEVFDAIPDVMRYERVPFKDISAVRSSMPFSQVPFVIRRTPGTHRCRGHDHRARTDAAVRGDATGFSRVVIDSLTALQYFCMKGFNEVAGAQTFLRFLSDLQVTTFITVESPLEDVDTTERVLARGEIRLFRWELDNASVRAIGVEKFRGSSHDVRLHPYRIGPKGLDINLTVTISRDTRQIIEPVPLVTLKVPEPAGSFGGSPLDPLMEEVRDLAAIGADVGPVRTEIEAALAAVALKDEARAPAHIARASALAMDLSGAYRTTPPPDSAHRSSRRLRGLDAGGRTIRRGSERRRPDAVAAVPRARASAAARPGRTHAGPAHPTGRGGPRKSPSRHSDGPADAGATDRPEGSSPCSHPGPSDRSPGRRASRPRAPGPSPSPSASAGPNGPESSAPGALRPASHSSRPAGGDTRIAADHRRAARSRGPSAARGPTPSAARGPTPSAARGPSPSVARGPGPTSAAGGRASSAGGPSRDHSPDQHGRKRPRGGTLTAAARGTRSNSDSARGPRDGTRRDGPLNHRRCGCRAFVPGRSLRSGARTSDGRSADFPSGNSG